MATKKISMLLCLVFAASSFFMFAMAIESGGECTIEGYDEPWYQIWKRELDENFTMNDAQELCMLVEPEGPPPRTTHSYPNEPGTEFECCGWDLLPER